MLLVWSRIHHSFSYLHLPKHAFSFSHTFNCHYNCFDQVGVLFFLLQWYWVFHDWFSAKTVYQIDGPEEQRDMIDDYNRFEELLKFIQYEKNHQRDYERYLQKRAKAIVKGDPREFMG